MSDAEIEALLRSRLEHDEPGRPSLPLPRALTPLQRAFLALEDAQARLARMEQAAREPIAVIGIGCRVPGGGNDAASFWKLMRDGVDAIGPVPADRWDAEALYDPDPATPGRIATRSGGFLESVDQFDPGFFGIAPREAQGMDPQQRLLLEVAWEALEHAGRRPTGWSIRAPASSSACAAATTPTCRSRAATVRCSTRISPRASRTAWSRGACRTCWACRGRASRSTRRARRRWSRCTWPASRCAAASATWRWPAA